MEPPPTITQTPTPQAKPDATGRDKPPVPLIPILAAISVISLLLTGFFIFQNLALQKRLDEIVQTQVTPTPTPNETSDWKTYTNTEFGFAIDYPSQYLVEENKFGSRLENLQLIIKKSLPSGLIIRAARSYTTNDLNYVLDTPPIGERELAGVTWKVFSTQETPKPPSQSDGSNFPAPPIITYTLTTVYKSTLYTIELSPPRNELQNQILSSFKLL